MQNIKRKKYLSQNKIQMNNFAEHSIDGSRFIYEQMNIKDESDELFNLGSMDSIYYPGAVFKIKKSDIDDAKIILIHLKRKPMSISADFSTSSGIDSRYLCQTIETPEFANVSYSIGELCQSIRNANIGLSTQTQIFEINYSKNNGFKFGFGLNLSQIFTELSTTFNFSKNDNFNLGIMIIKQVYFTISMSIPNKGIYDIFYGSKEEVDSEIGIDYVPVCCSCSYGRIAIVLIKTKMKIHDFKAGFNIGFNKIGVNPDFENQCRKSSTTYDFFIYGGSQESQKIVSSGNIYEIINKFMNAPVDSPKCIGYKFYDIVNLTFVKFVSYNKCIKRKLSPILIKKTYIKIKNQNNEYVSSANPGEKLIIEVEIHPENASLFKTKCIINDERYGYINNKTNNLILFNDIIEDKDIKITFQTIQKNEGKPHVVESSFILKINTMLNVNNNSTIRTEKICHISDIFQANDYCLSKDIVSYIIPKGFKEIGANSFSNYLSLVHVEIQSNIQKVNDKAFSRCVSLQTIKIPAGLLEICNSSFWLCKSLLAITLPKGIKVIGNYAFSGCESLASINLPDTIYYIGDEAFSNCISLKSIKIPLGTKEIRRSVFYGCLSLENIVIHDDVANIFDRAFCKCTSIKSIMLPLNIVKIGTNVFSNCESLQNIYIPHKIIAQIGLFKSISKYLDLPRKCIIHKK